MKKLIYFFVIVLVTFTTSCKKCDPSNSESGLIIKDAIVRVIGNAPQGGLFVASAADYPDQQIEMSLNGGQSYTPVDYSKYSVFSLVTSSSCSSGYDRNVSMDAKNEVVTYSIQITECSTCSNTTTISNWVLTSKVPSNYTAVFDIDKK
ncbi:hypothetical protein CW751_04880 [Brumimicrobium salinarum]|uniref:Uncharacterized protein n=1 Tax=Brumimicrobium salinarum TaxID=2058658 RepID=A0A2I0R487_9FLAO|nr:hypothetical protein [Brumimicrobium salinarum]PKR81394.1 hypothetical protein CW751_04880 [Brumimicrobium salinarum]